MLAEFFSAVEVDVANCYSSMNMFFLPRILQHSFIFHCIIRPKTSAPDQNDTFLVARNSPAVYAPTLGKYSQIF